MTTRLHRGFLADRATASNLRPADAATQQSLRRRAAAWFKACARQAAAAQGHSGRSEEQEVRRTKLALAAMVASCLSAHAADYPAKAITIIVPFAPGGSNDIVARAIGKKMSEDWGQAVVVDNRAGAGGVIGADFVARAAPDGYTLLLVSSTFTINPAVKSSLPFDTMKDFVPVAEIAQSPLLLAASNSFPANSVADLIALAKAKPASITFASAGPGSINHIAAELLAGSAGIKLVHVPYRGGALAINDLVGGHVDVYVSSLPQILQIARAGQAKALAVTGTQRAPALPDVPTMIEAGIPGYEAGSWWGIVAPAGTPADVVASLNAEINKTLSTPEMNRFLDSEGAQAVPGTPKQFGDLVASEIQRWTKVARDADIHAD
jgi:tripartite-type tricarboxylate transporter receptor subunit TctC